MGLFRWVALPLVVFLGLALLFFVSLSNEDPSKLPSQLIGRPAPETAFEPLDGLVSGGTKVAGFSADDLKKGEVSVVNFWASWCAPCIQEHPLLMALKTRGDVAIYGVNYKDEAVNARRFIGRFGNPFKAVGVDETGRKAIEWGVGAMPETFIVNGNGEIIYKHTGPIDGEALEKKLLPLIRQARKAG